jgi:hypothetical protein
MLYNLLYSARRGRVKRVQESLENTLSARIELMESYAKVIKKTFYLSIVIIFSPLNCAEVLYVLLQLCSMIEIEVEMDSNVIAAEAASSAVCTLCFLLIHTICR